ncbi:MAG: DUF3077 domain-containing protein [Pseudomonas sp.]|uniref:DUF3077 domain-containing protein n=1 Tax=Pseudomonas sp. TaxID=306 RepID=UPI003D113A4F
MTDHQTPPLDTRTTHTPFHPINTVRQPLFAVQPDVPLADALDSVYCLLDVAEGLTLRLSEPGAPDREQVGHACSYLVEMAKATVRSCIEGLEQVSRPG